MKIEVMIQCHNFEKRLCWMLSSILQQVPNEGKSLPDISVNIACAKTRKKLSVSKLAMMFMDAGLDISILEYPDFERFQYRGLVRNDQLEKSDADWALFADSDMVYHPKFFATLGKLLRKGYKGSDKCLHSARHSTFLEETKAMVDSYKYPCIIPNAFFEANKLKRVRKANVGAGYCQIANIHNLRENHNGKYQISDKPIDWSWKSKMQKAKSDMHFRKMLGAEKIALPMQIHLQHERDNEFGKHLTIQR